MRRTAGFMSLVDLSFCTLRIDPFRRVQLIPEEPEDFVHEISGRVLCADLEASKDRIAGRFRLYYVDFELAQNHGMSAVEVLDANQHTLEFASAILDRNQAPFSSQLQGLLGDEIWNSNLIILDRLEILPKYRGRGAGLMILIALIERFGSGAGVVGMKPFPLQSEPSQSADSSWAKRLKLRNLSSDHKMSERKLKQYYGNLGFIEMRSTAFMFWNMSWALPSIEQLQTR
jgi:GNAT superfamily N-acetyltransferase